MTVRRARRPGRAKPAARANHAPPTSRDRPERVRLDVDERRHQLVQLGLEYFGTHAYDDVSIDVIARAAGISKGLLYHYFPTKRAYYAACVRQAAEDLVTSTEVHAGAELAPVERMAAAIDAYLAFARAHGRAYTTLMRSVGVDAEIRTIVEQTRATFVDRLRVGFEESAIAIALPEPARALLDLALRGWIGFAETVSLAWLDALEAEDPRAPTQGEIRALVAASFLQIVRAAVGAD